MSGLQEAFYIVGIVYMGISLLLIIGLAIAVGVIRKKIVTLEKTITEKIEMVITLPAKVESVVNAVKHLAKHGPK